MKTKAWQIQILGILALLLLFILTIPIFANRIPEALETYLTQQFIDQGYDWVHVSVKGRNVILSGNAPTTEKSFAALHVTEKYKPILQINDQITPRIIQPYSMKMDWDGESLILNGYLPDQASYQSFIEMSHQLVDKNNIQSNLEIGTGAPDNWLVLVTTSLQGVLKLQRGNVEIINKLVYFSGQTPYSAQRDQIKQSLARYRKYQKKMYVIAADEKDKLCQSKFKQLLDVNNIKFLSGKAIIDKSSNSVLTKLLNITLLCPRSQISIEGHTDNRGSRALNMKLSQQRAQRVLDWLFKQGIEKNQLSAIGYGADKPITENDTEKGRARNRRIEVIVKSKRKGDQ